MLVVVVVVEYVFDVVFWVLEVELGYVVFVE